MKRVLRLELRRAFVNRSFVVAVLVGCAVVMSRVVAWVIPTGLSWADQWREYGAPKGAYPFSLYNSWIGGQGYLIQNTLYFVLIPLMACLPYAASFYSDRATGYTKNILTRIDRRSYYYAKCLSIFLVAGSAVILPLLFDIVATALFFPALIPEVTAGTFTIVQASMWSGLFYSYPSLYILCYLVLIALWTGLIALLAVPLSYIVSNRVIVALGPFVLLWLVDFVLHALPAYTYQFSPLSLLSPAQPWKSSFVVSVVEWLCLAALLGSLVFVRARRDQTY